MANLNLKAGDNITLTKIGEDLEIASDKSEIIVSSTEPNTGEEVWLQKGESLYDKNNITSNTSVDYATGATYSDNNSFTTNYISVSTGKTYKFNGSSDNNGRTWGAIYDSSQNYIGKIDLGLNEKSIFIGITNASYIRLGILNTYVDSFFIREANDKIYTKNDNGVYEEFYKIPSSLSVGQGTIDSNYISNVELNHWEKIGNVVTYSFTLTTTGTWTPNTQFITNLPKPISSLRFHGVNDSANTPLRFEITSLGTIVNAWSNTTPSANQTIEGHITYLTND